MPCTRNYKKWSPEEDEQLKTHYDNSKSFRYVANKLSRTIDAVQARYVKKYIYPEHNIQYLKKNRKELADKFKISHEDFVRYLRYVDIKCKSDESDASDTDSASHTSSDTVSDASSDTASDTSLDSSDTSLDSSEVSDSSYAEERKYLVKINVNPFMIGSIAGITCAITGGIMAYTAYTAYTAYNTYYPKMS